MADGHTLSEWVRDVLLGMVAPQPADHVLVAEVLALRIVLNLQIRLAISGAPTLNNIRQLVERSDQDEPRQAGQRLTAATGP